MSTPTASQHTPQQPGSASKKAAGHVTTPSHLGLASPAPRSVPSPAATRKDQAGKTPVNHPTVGSSGSKTLGGTPMMHNLSQTGMTVSSSPGALAGLGLDLGSTTPGQLSNLLAGGTAMMPTMSDLGLGSRGGKRNEDEERKDKMRRVLKNIGRRKGRVSQDAIARIGRRVGLDIDADADSAEERARTMGNRALAIAGSYSLVEVSLKQHVPQKVDVMITGEGSDLEEFGNAAGKLLLNDLRVPDGILLHSDLDQFARNLNRLARLDILSKTGKVNCFQAICGMYKSLKKLYDLEIEAVKGRKGEAASINDAKAADEVLRKRSGKPMIHGNERIGLALEYWTAAQATSNKQEDSAMDVDEEKSQTPECSQSDVYKLQIEAEASPAPMLSALRVSDAWLPDAFELPAPESGEAIPWQDPPPTYVTDSTTDGNGVVTAVDGTERPPDLRFAAKLDPPVVLPWNMVTMLSEVGIELPQIGQVGDYYDALLGMDTNMMAARHQPIEAEQIVLSVKDAQEVDVAHRYVLDISKPDHGYKLEKLYFSHPRQLVGLLPILRQWAQVGALVHSAFGNQEPKPKEVLTNSHANGHANGHEMEVDSLDESLLVNIGLSALPQPTLSITLPESANTIFQIMPNASLAVTNHDGDEEGAKKLATALELCGDLGVWVEWMRRQ